MFDIFVTKASTFEFLAPIVSKVIYIFIILLFGLFISRAVRKLMDNNNLKKLDPTLVPVFSSLLSYLVLLITAVIILDLIGFNTNSLIAVLGAAGLAVGLALKNTLQNIAAGLFLLVLRPFKNGDSISVRGYMGSISQINLFATSLKTSDGVDVFIPNSLLWSCEVKNYSTYNLRRASISVGVAYDSDISYVERVIKNVLAADVRILQEPKPLVFIENFADSSICVQFRYWSKSSDYFSVYRDIRGAIKVAFERSNINIPFPQHDIRLCRNDIELMQDGIVEKIMDKNKDS